MNTITVVANKELGIRKFPSNPVSAVKLKAQLEAVFGAKFTISVYRDVWEMTRAL